MGTLNNNQFDEMEDEPDIICLSSDSEGSDSEDQHNSSVSNNCSSKSTRTVNSPPPKSPTRPEVKMENNVSNISNPTTDRSPPISNNDNDDIRNNVVRTAVEQFKEAHAAAVTSQQQQALLQSDVVTHFPFNAFALFGPENSAMPIEERLAAFINNISTLTEEKLKLENAERQAKRKYEEANNQLSTANQEISKLKKNLVDSQSKINQQSGSLSELKSTVEKLQKQEHGSKSKLKSITSTLMHLQSKMVQVLEETEVDTIPSLGTQDPTAASTSIQATLAPSSISEYATGSSAEVILKENIEMFEKEFEAKFSQVEEKDKEIKSELRKTNDMLQRIQASLMEQFQSEESPASSSSPQLTYESMDMDDQDLADEQIDPSPGSSTASLTPTNGNVNGVPKKVSRQEDSKINHKLLHARDPKKRFSCICGARYGTLYSITRHLRQELGKNHFACNLCSVSFFELCNLRKHYESVHELHYPSKISGCTGCGKVFTSFDVLSKHRRRCNGRADTGSHNSETISD